MSKSMLKELKERHREVGRLLSQGLSISEVAKRVGLASGTVSTLSRDPLMQGYLKGLADRADTVAMDARKKMAELIFPAIEIQALMVDPKRNAHIKPETQLAASKDILDRTGFKPPEQSNHAHVVITAADLLELKRRSEEVNLDYMKTIN